MQLYPLLMQPYFRHGVETPWGGRALADFFGKPIPDALTGESLEISALHGMESRVKNGVYAGKTLPEMVKVWGDSLTGPIDGDFPLLLKLLDAREMLSVQVHPDDLYAAREGKRGKTEAWVVLNASQGAKIVYGLKPLDRPLAEIVESGKLADALLWVDARPGDVFYVPHGTVHAAGANMQLYEIQQSSDATYRFWDWDRKGADGIARALHTAQALAVSKIHAHPPKAKGVTMLAEGGSRTVYIANRHFELSRINLSGKMPLTGARMLFLTPLQRVEISWPGGKISPAPFESVLIPAGLCGVTLKGSAKVLCSSLPDRESLKKQLGYRAGDILGIDE